MSEQMNLPRYRSHKEVQAARIVGVEPDHRGDAMRRFPRWRLDNGVLIELTQKLMDRVPAEYSATDGYYVRYADGFESWSPAEAFESGYSLAANTSE